MIWYEIMKFVKRFALLMELFEAIMLFRFPSDPTKDYNEKLHINLREV